MEFLTGLFCLVLLLIALLDFRCTLTPTTLLLRVHPRHQLTRLYYNLLRPRCRRNCRARTHTSGRWRSLNYSRHRQQHLLRPPPYLGPTQPADPADAASRDVVPSTRAVPPPPTSAPSQRQPPTGNDHSAQTTELTTILLPRSPPAPLPTRVVTPRPSSPSLSLTQQDTTVQLPPQPFPAPPIPPVRRRPFTYLDNNPYPDSDLE